MDKKKLAVIGNPVKHSLSPTIHNAVLDYCGINAIYEAVELDIKSDSTDITSLFNNNNFVGCNITYPFKQKAFDACDILSKSAINAKAVNTIYKNSRDELIGDSTDGKGFLLGLGGVEIPTNVAILGAGGAAISIIDALSELEKVSKIQVYVRDIKKYEFLLNQFKKVELKNIKEFIDSKFIINATPLGMGENIGLSPIKSEQYNNNIFVFDTIYSPFKTQLLIDSEKKNCEIKNGLSMLIGQAVLSFQLFFPDTISKEKCFSLMFDAAKKKLGIDE